MNRSDKRTLKLGLMVVVGLVLFSIAIYYLGSQQNLFKPSIAIKSYFKNVSGLVEGNKVRYSGITVGSVSHIEIIEDTIVLVEMSVDRKMSTFIRTDSRAEITSDGLMGNKIINIHPGSAEAVKITDEGFIKSQEPVDFQEVIEDAREIVKEGQLTINNLLQISQKLNDGEGDLARLINENTLTTKLSRAGDEALAVIKSTGEIVDKINKGEGDLGRMVNDTVISGKITRLMSNMEETASKTDSIAGQLLRFSTELNEGNGLINRLVYDSVMADKIDTTLANADRGIEQAIKAAETVERSWLMNLFSGKK